MVLGRLADSEDCLVNRRDRHDSLRETKHKCGEPSDSPKDRALRIDNGNHNAGPR